MEWFYFYIIAVFSFMFLCGLLLLISEKEIFPAVILSVFLGIPVVIFIFVKSFKHFKYKYLKNKDDED